MTIPKKTIEFASPSALGHLATPWDKPEHSSHGDLVLKPEFAARKYTFPLGTTWLRLMPPLVESKRAWMLGVHVLKYAGGQHVHPRSLKAGGKSVFDLAYAWLQEKRPGELFCKANMTGYKLLSKPMFLFWILVEEGGKPVARIVCASGYDGLRGGTPGLGHQIWRASQELDEDGQRVADPAYRTDCAQICVDKSQPPGSKYPSYSLRVGRTPAPIDQFIDRMDLEECAAVAPIESVVYLPEAAEEWTLLEKVIDPALVAEIRASQP